jgi:2-(3-amino-3-carboxypropyl)histidine synthase
MKILYFETKRRKQQNASPSFNFSVLPKTLLLVYSIQYKHLAQEIKERLLKEGFNITGFQQVLGCSKVKSKEAILLIGSGKFHALNLAMQNPVPIYIYDSGNITQLDEKSINDLKEKKKGAFSKFLHANTLGIIVSTKPGQENLKKAQLVKERILSKYPSKEISIILSEHITLQELENFPFDFYVNTACIGLFYDTNKIVNADDILEFLALN